MTGWGRLAGLPPAARWGMLGVGGLLVAVVAGSAVWAILQQGEAAAGRAFTAASATYRQAMAGRDAGQLTTATTALRRFLADHPRSRSAAQASYMLGNLAYERRDFDAARAAFEEAARRQSGTIGALSRLGLGYVWEAKGDPGQALAAYRQALTGRAPKDFLYVELLLGVARAQELQSDQAGAIETYRRLLHDVPDLPRAGEVRSRLAALGASA